MSLNLKPYLFGATGNKGASGASGSSSSVNTRGWLPFGTTDTSGWGLGMGLGTSGWNATMNAQTWLGGVKRIAVYLFAVLIVVGILLLFVHFFIRPVFRRRAGAPGWITIPGLDDGALFWKNGNTGAIEEGVLPIQNQYYGYTLQLDLFLQNPFQFSTRPRLLLTRGGSLKTTPSGDQFLGILNQYNLAIALKPDTNDMLVSVLTTTGNDNMGKESIVSVVPNIPVQIPFRITVIVMERAMEVYMNGHLIQTVSYHNNLMDVKGGIAPASGAEANIVQYRNLKIWPRVLTTPEIREATPALSSAADMNPTPMPSSSSCSV
jgi:hypothetical protein